MTISEFSTRIEHRVAELDEEIARVQAADQALAATGPWPVAVDPGSSERRRRRAAAVRATPRRHRAAARRGPKPAAVLALARELDAGLRNRP